MGHILNTHCIFLAVSILYWVSKLRAKISTRCIDPNESLADTDIDRRGRVDLQWTEVNDRLHTRQSLDHTRDFGGDRLQWVELCDSGSSRLGLWPITSAVALEALRGRTAYVRGPSDILHVTISRAGLGTLSPLEPFPVREFQTGVELNAIEFLE
jgi:hypothetical protein